MFVIRGCGNFTVCHVPHFLFVEEQEPPRPIYGVSSQTKDAAPELSEQIEEMHVAILDKLDQIQQLRTSLRRDYVPSTVVTHLEQCIKETEVSVVTAFNLRVGLNFCIVSVRTFIVI